jgi:protein gp37
VNKTKIEWVRNSDGTQGYVWNPVRGCLHNCSYCYGKRIDKRFGDGSFTPTFHPERLQEPLKVKKPSRIFVGSMADLFGDWEWKDNNAIYKHSSEEVKASVIDIAYRCPHHTFIFLTKNPRGMQGIDFPDNCWCGTSVENQEKADERIPELLKVNCKTLFVSYEPALGSVDFSRIVLGNNVWVNAVTGDCKTYSPFGGLKTMESSWRRLDWLIIGAQTGPGAIKPHHAWISGAINQAGNANIPVFVKDNVNWFSKIQEWPEGVKSC